MPKLFFCALKKKFFLNLVHLSVSIKLCFNVQKNWSLFLKFVFWSSHSRACRFLPDLTQPLGSCTKPVRILLSLESHRSLSKPRSKRWTRQHTGWQQMVQALEGLQSPKTNCLMLPAFLHTWWKQSVHKEASRRCSLNRGRAQLYFWPWLCKAGQLIPHNYTVSPLPPHERMWLRRNILLPVCRVIHIVVKIRLCP